MPVPCPALLALLAAVALGAPPAVKDPTLPDEPGVLVAAARTTLLAVGEAGFLRTTLAAGERAPTFRIEGAAVRLAGEPRLRGSVALQKLLADRAGTARLVAVRAAADAPSEQHMVRVYDPSELETWSLAAAADPPPAYGGSVLAVRGASRGRAAPGVRGARASHQDWILEDAGVALWVRGLAAAPRPGAPTFLLADLVAAGSAPALRAYARGPVVDVKAGARAPRLALDCAGYAWLALPAGAPDSYDVRVEGDALSVAATDGGTWLLLRGVRPGAGRLLLDGRAGAAAGLTALRVSVTVGTALGPRSHADPFEPCWCPTAPRGR